MKTSTDINELAAALAKAQGEMKGATKDAKNPFFGSNYADLASVWDACREPLTKHGLSVVQFPKSKAYGTPEVYQWESKKGETQFGVKVVYEVAVLTRIAHSSGQWMEDRISTLLPNGNPQAVGSAITYLRRYALQSVAGIAPEDDDAEAATTRGNERRNEAPRPQAPPPPPAPPAYECVTVEQVEAIHIAAKASGLKTLGPLKKALMEFAGVAEAKLVPADKYEYVLDQLALLGAPEPPTNDAPDPFADRDDNEGDMRAQGGAR